MTMETIGETLNKKKWTPKQDSFDGLPIRASVKQTRLYLDNEYFKKGYAAIFPHSATVVYNILAMFANHKKQICYPAAKTIMELGGITNRNTLFQALFILDRYGIISIVRRSKGRVPNVYALLDSRDWKEVNNSNFDTVMKERQKKPTVSETDAQQLQNNTSNGITGETGIHLMDSTKEIISKNTEKKIPLKGKQLLERLSPATTSVVVPYFCEEDIIRVLEEIYESGEIETPSFKTILRALRQSEAVPTTELPSWLKL